MAGGRWFECTVSQRLSDGLYKVLVHDGASRNFPAHKISPLEVESQVGDPVIAYYDVRSYAFQGIHESTRADGTIHVRFADGDAKDVAADWVHKLQTIGRCG